MADRTVFRTRCTVCDTNDLPTRKWLGQLWLYCPTDATGPEDAHTAYPIKKYAKNNWEIERVPIDSSKHSELEETKEAPVEDEPVIEEAI